MQVRQILTAVVCLAIGWSLIAIRSNHPHPVEYPKYSGTNPTPVSISFAVPTDDLKQLPEIQVADKFLPGELLSLEGELKLPPGGPRPLLVEFWRNNSSGKRQVANSIVELPQGDLAHYKIRVNTPAEPGRYRLEVQWIGGLITARALIDVVEQPNPK